MPKGVSAAEKKERVLKWFQTNKKVVQLAPALQLPACAHRGLRGAVLGPEGC